MQAILHHIHRVFGYEIYDKESSTKITDYIYKTFPGEYHVSVYMDDDNQIQVDFTFDTGADKTWFLLKYS
jgi:hypothetical protein